MQRDSLGRLVAPESLFFTRQPESSSSRAAQPQGSGYLWGAVPRTVGCSVKSRTITLQTPASHLAKL